MDDKQYNRWAAKFLGEDEAGQAHAEEESFYTSSPAAAFALLAKSARDGLRIEVEVADDGYAEVHCGKAESNGLVADLAYLIVEACYRCHAG